MRDEKVNYKIRELSLAKTPIISVVGEKEMENETVTVRRLGVDEQSVIGLEKFVQQIANDIKMPN